VCHVVYSLKSTVSGYAYEIFLALLFLIVEIHILKKILEGTLEFMEVERDFHCFEPFWRDLARQVSLQCR
jgi:hypothetical protein